MVNREKDRLTERNYVLLVALTASNNNLGLRVELLRKQLTIKTVFSQLLDTVHQTEYFQV